MSGFSKQTKQTVGKIPLLKTRAGPRDGEAWATRLREELTALIGYVQHNKSADNDWFTIAPNKAGTSWSGKCWTFHEGLRYEFILQFDIPVGYPATNPELCLPELEGKTAKMYRGGKICLTDHFQPLWQKNVPKFGIAHALALGLGPYLAAEVPDLVSKGLIQEVGVGAAAAAADGASAAAAAR
jgi:ufm1-conjugating enzyme 1